MNIVAVHGASGRDFKVHWWACHAARCDRHRSRRVDSYTYELAVNQAMLYAGYGESSTRQPQTALPTFRKTFGYGQHAVGRAVVTRALSTQRFSATVRDLLNHRHRAPRSSIVAMTFWITTNSASLPMPPNNKVAIISLRHRIARQWQRRSQRQSLWH